MIVPSLKPTSSRTLRVKLTGDQAFRMSKVLEVYKTNYWREADFRYKLDEAISKLWRFHYRHGLGQRRHQPDTPDFLSLPEWQASFIVNAFEEWLLEYGRYRKAGTKGEPRDWQPERIVTALGWTAEETIPDFKTKIATEAVQLFKTARLV